MSTLRLQIADGCIASTWRAIPYLVYIVLTHTNLNMGNSYSLAREEAMEREYQSLVEAAEMGQARMATRLSTEGSFQQPGEPGLAGTWCL